MDIEKLFKEFVEKEWHDGHEPQGGYDHYDEDEEVEEARTYIDRKYEKKKKGITPQSQKKKRWGSGGYGKGEEVEESEEDEAYGGTAKKKKSQKILKSKGYFHRKDRPAGWVEDSEVEESTTKYAKSLEKIANDKALKMLSKSERENLKKIAALLSKEKTLGEAYKDLPPHLQKLIKKIEKKQKDWNKQNPGAKIQTLVYNPETGKPDIIVKETMKLEDTVKSVMEGKLPPALQKAIDKKKGKKDDSEKDDPEVKKEDTDPDTPGTQGDKAKYLKARAKVLKKFGVKSCSELEGDEKKACYSALDAAHVSDDEEGKSEKKEDAQKFSKLFSHLKGMMKEKKKKMLKGYSSNY